ncbi:hypothetical protein U8335_26770 [Roseiconus lacunae]|uniref:hypothetical protein n=1 Tax=Roseiconus lacunae TaxID=2605694 RepID=UPI001E539299|nr:hypothetical protein [Roseiconus lacunae]MCD0459967.1 hypothetical protein [Roseiconus lacunae]WRQ50538.1 hypothetical protein U8335_26770 [Stieleria sp. HD01]
MSRKNKRYRLRKRIAKRMGYTNFADIPVDELLSYECKDDCEDRMIWNSVSNQGKRSIKERIGRVPRLQELTQIEPLDSAERLYLIRMLSHRRVIEQIADE